MYETLLLYDAINQGRSYHIRTYACAYLEYLKKNILFYLFIYLFIYLLVDFLAKSDL